VFFYFLSASIHPQAQLRESEIVNCTSQPDLSSTVTVPLIDQFWAVLKMEPGRIIHLICYPSPRPHTGIVQPKITTFTPQSLRQSSIL